ncbi:MAG: hypothetical protein LBR34_09090 [Prevotella sp.]|jgi:hypothetical protein|nr:hypothetical protein [Prevotella sp.]
MKLGNTAGKNKGKKYLKITGKETVTAENQAKADHFKHWFGENYLRLRKELIQKDTFDEDILNETFLRIYDKVLFGGQVILNYKAYFHRAFFTNFMQETINLSKGLMASIDNYDAIDDSDSLNELIGSKIKLESDILDYVHDKYPVADYELFCMYVRLKPAINYAELSKITKVPQSRVSETIHRIRRDICSDNIFVARRQAVLRGFVG